MSFRWIVLACLACSASTGAWAINDKYAKQLERSGCTQVTELQGCDITKTKAQNAKAGFGTAGAASSAAPAASAPAQAASAPATPYAGQWLAKTEAGAKVASIRIDAKERVWVNGKRVTAKRSDGGLMFKAGRISYMIQGDRRLKGEDLWNDFGKGTKGPIVQE